MSALDDELWVVVKNFPDYEVSSLGTVLDLTSDTEVFPYQDLWGYSWVLLNSEMGWSIQYVHLLVAEAFFLDYEEGMDVWHENNHKQDNTVLNLTLGVKEEKHDVKPVRRDRNEDPDPGRS